MDIFRLLIMQFNWSFHYMSLYLFFTLQYNQESNDIFDASPSSLARAESSLLVSRTQDQDEYTCVVTSGAKTTRGSTIVYSTGHYLSVKHIYLNFTHSKTPFLIFTPIVRYIQEKNRNI